MDVEVTLRLVQVVELGLSGMGLGVFIGMLTTLLVINTVKDMKG